MGVQNTAAKNYMSRNDIFAQLVNYYVFHGREAVRPTDLRSVDASEVILLPDRTGGKRSVEKYRDILKQCVFKVPEEMGYLFIGIENQTEVHYAMPVRSMLYDALNYAGQVSKMADKHKRERDVMTSAEFLSGLKKEDRLVPVITVIVYSRVRNEPNASLLALGDCARVAEHPVDVRLATTEEERRPNTPPLGVKLAKEPKGSFRETKSCPVALLRGI